MHPCSYSVTRVSGPKSWGAKRSQILRLRVCWVIYFCLCTMHYFFWSWVILNSNSSLSCGLKNPWVFLVFRFFKKMLKKPEINSLRHSKTRSILLQCLNFLSFHFYYFLFRFIFTCKLEKSCFKIRVKTSRQSPMKNEAPNLSPLHCNYYSTAIRQQ